MKKYLLASMLCIAPNILLAQVTVTDPWVRATVPTQKATGAFMQLTSKTDARLIEARSPGLVTEIHEMAMKDDVMRMRQIDGLDLPAGKSVELKPGSYHVMFFDIKKQIKEGDVIPLTLVFESKDRKRETVELKVPARALNNAVSVNPTEKMHSGH
ncbi:copper chaperone PCu(A)C [Herminiimonas contaminans]|uniref:Copper chaperone PCu(A)C n=1 Tax=Herminiimonas contaminans TaxID=1111140 RepID=A0ABS0EXL4_9BURK|nr:copper chaperone PCu(A)C [Herminiimonas contaminans]MBF8179268.1 copper chaperone PCu(A)C [Herminiimonas contaminans]